MPSRNGDDQDDGDDLDVENGPSPPPEPAQAGKNPNKINKEEGPTCLAWYEWMSKYGTTQKKRIYYKNQLKKLAKRLHERFPNTFPPIDGATVNNNTNPANEM